MASPGDPALPAWAVAQASAALKIGLPVHQIEEQLVAKGLDPATATAVVNAVLEGQLRTGAESPGPSDSALRLHRLASLLALCACLGLAYAFGGGLSVGRTIRLLFLPIACIWWAEMLEDNAPPALLRWVAWLVVLLIAGYRVVLLLL